MNQIYSNRDNRGRMIGVLAVLVVLISGDFFVSFMGKNNKSKLWAEYSIQ